MKSVRSLILGPALILAGCSSMLGGELIQNNEPTGAITIENHSGIEMNVVTLSRCNAMSHGLSRLNSGETIPSGYSRTWRVGAGCWDIGVGRTGTCVNGSCSWNEAYKKVQVNAGQTYVSRWRASGAE